MAPTPLKNEMYELFDNKYRYIKDLGKGGFGKVFLAKEEHSENFVAIKQLLNQSKSKQNLIIREMQMVSKFNHPNIINYKHHFVQDDVLYLVMEYCSIGSLRSLIRKDKITSTFVWKWMDELTKTLQFVHEKNIIHRDIKPDNILFTEDRIIKIADFGIANTEGGTTSYLSPECFDNDIYTANDPRVDIYALGVTLIEILTGNNPFSSKSTSEIIDLHEQKDFKINNLPSWQQEIILKAIAEKPELRFQSMQDFNEAINAQSVPVIFDKDIIKAGDYAEKAAICIKNKKWLRALSLLDYAERELKPSVNVLQLKGKYYLLQKDIEKAKFYFEKALKWNSRLDVQKELGWINLELKNYPTAISLLSDHIHRNPSDFESYNLLLQCFYETNRYEQAMDVARTLLEVDPTNHCFINNYYICHLLQNMGHVISPAMVLKIDKTVNHFLNYNYSVIKETESTHNFNNTPTLKSKLLFMDYRFNKFSTAKIYCVNGNKESFLFGETEQAIIKIGREEYEINDVKVPGGATISRRHALIINSKDDIWLYDLDSTGTFLNDDIVNFKAPLIGRNIIKIGKTEYEITNDKSKLF